MAAANDLRKGMCIRYNGNPAIVLEVQHRTPGNLRAFVQAIIRYIGTGKSADVRFGSTESANVKDSAVRLSAGKRPFPVWPDGLKPIRAWKSAWVTIVLSI